MEVNIPRLLGTHIKKAASRYPVVTLNGPRQSGKTTLCKMLFPEKKYVSLENPDQRSFATTDPRGFLNHYSGGAILDEIQNAPEVMSYIQELVDSSNAPGQFILTGSNNLLLNQHVTQSLAGRTAFFHLLPFSVPELRAANEPGTNIAENLCLHGFYPRVWRTSHDAYDYYQNYIHAYLERDLRQLINIRHLTKFQHFLELCAGRAGSILNKAAMSSDLGLSEPTIEEWLSVLEAGFIIKRLQPFSQQIGKRIVKSPKLYFVDTGILCALLRIRNIETLRLHPLYGLIYENLIFSEISKQQINSNTPARISFYRDQSGNEIDFVLEDGPHISLIEAKSAQTFSSHFCDVFRKVRTYMGEEKIVGQTIYYNGDITHKTQDGILSQNILAPAQNSRLG
jgi:predicted AAA+ superfamily ATPase